MNHHTLISFSSLFSKTNSRSRLLWVNLFFLSYLLVGLGVYQDYGVSWDKPISRSNGMITLKYLGEIFVPEYVVQDAALGRYPALADYIDKDYGVAYELPVSFLEKILHLDDSRDVYLLRHLTTFLVFFAGVFAFFQLAERRYLDWRLGLLGALILILSPRLFAESFYNSKDVVFMALFAIALNTAVLFLQNPTIRTACWHALATAVLIDVRLMGVILPAATLVVIALRLGRGEVALQKTLLSIFIYLILCVFLVIVFWPYLWSAPLDNFLQAFKNMANFRWNNPVRYFGEWVPATKLPWHYILVWFGISTPLAYIFTFFIGAITILRRLFQRRLSLWNSDAEWQDLLFLGLFVTPSVAVIILNSVLYDGWRQMYFIYPAFVLVALHGLVVLFKWHLPHHSKIWLRIVSLGALISFMATGGWMMRAHPYQNVYFNMAAGRNVKENFEVDYWGLSSREVLQYIVDNDRRSSISVWPGSGIPLDRGILLLEPVDRKRLAVTDKEENADYVITQFRWNLTDYGGGNRGYERFYQIDVDEEAIISVFKR